MKRFRALVATVLSGVILTSPVASSVADTEGQPQAGNRSAESNLEWRIDPAVPTNYAGDTMGPTTRAYDPDSGLPPFAACGFLTDEHKIVAKWHNVTLGKPHDFMHAQKIFLVCGNGDYGLKHIRKGHAHQFAPLAAIEGKGPDHLMRIALDATLENTKYSVRAKSKGPDGKFCATSKIHLVDKRSGKIVKTMWPTTIVGEHRPYVVSLYPTTKHSKCDKFPRNAEQAGR